MTVAANSIIHGHTKHPMPVFVMMHHRTRLQNARNKTFMTHPICLSLVPSFLDSLVIALMMPPTLLKTKHSKQAWAADVRVRLGRVRAFAVSRILRPGPTRRAQCLFGRSAQQRRESERRRLLFGKRVTREPEGKCEPGSVSTGRQRMISLSQAVFCFCCFAVPV